MSNTVDDFQYTPAADPDELALRWLRRARESQFGHYKKAVIYERLSKYFGIPVIIVTSIVSASVFTAMQENGSATVKGWAMGLSLLSVVLSSLQTFLNFTERAEKHRIAGAEYAALRRKLEMFHVAPTKQFSVLEEIGREISALATRVPALPSSKNLTK